MYVIYHRARAGRYGMEGCDDRSTGAGKQIRAYRYRCGNGKGIRPEAHLQSLAGQLYGIYINIYQVTHGILTLGSGTVKEKSFAAGCSRDVTWRGADQLGWELDKLLTMILEAMAATEDEVREKMAEWEKEQ